MTRPKTRTIVGIGLSSMYLILLTWTLFSAFDCEVVTYCLGLVVFYFGLPWTFLLSLIFNLYLLGITGISRLGFFLSGVAIIFNALILYVIPKLIAKSIYDAPGAPTNTRDSG